MGNDIEIRVTGTDLSGPAMLAATRNAQSLRDMVTKVGTSMRTAAGHARRLSDELGGVAASSTAAGRGLARLDTELLSASRSAAGLDEQVDDLQRSLNDLTRSTAPKLKLIDADRERAEVRKAVNPGALLPDLTRSADRIGAGFGKALGEAAGPQVVVGLSARLTAAGAGMGPAAAAIGAPLAGGIAAWLGASIAGAIIGGVGIGGVVGGLKVASSHSEVRSAATALGDEFEATMQRAAVAFVPAAIEGIGVLRSHLGGARSDIEDIFANSSRFVVPLAEGAGQGLRELLDGVRDVAEKADPVIDSIAGGMLRLGRAAGDGLSSLADNADGAGRALSLFFFLIDAGTRSVFMLVNALAETWEMIELGGAALYGNIPQMVELLTKTDEAKQANTGFGESFQQIIDGFRGESDAAEDAARATKTYADALDRIADQNLNVAEATLRYRDSLREVKDAADGKRGVNDDELDFLVRMAKSSNNLTEALEQQGASTATLAERQRTGRAEFIAAARAMGATQERAEELADAYLKIPRKAPTEVTADTDQAARNLRGIRELIAQIRSKKVVITTVGVRSEGRNVAIGDGIGGRAHGGITGAASGGLRGNLTVVGENGPELAELPPSTMVHPAGATQRMLASAGGGGPQIVINMSAGVIGSPGELQDWLARAMDEMVRRGRLSNRLLYP